MEFPLDDERIKTQQADKTVHWDGFAGRFFRAAGQVLHPHYIIARLFFETTFRSASKNLETYSKFADKEFTERLTPKDSQDGDKSIFHEVIYSNTLDNDAEIKEVTNAMRPMVKFGAMIVGVLFGGFLLWSYGISLDSAAVAPGTIVASSSNKTVQHLEGGIVEAVYVKEGDKVKVDQPLVKLRDTLARAKDFISTAGLKQELAAQARLVAERESKDKIEFGELPELAKTDQELAKILENQENLFQSKRKMLENQTAIFNERIDQNTKVIMGLQAQASAADSQMQLIKEELTMVEQLFQKGLATKPRLLALKRNYHDLEGNKGNYIAQIARSEETISEMKQQINTLKSNALKESLSELDTVQQKISELEGQQKATSDILKRTIIKAPQSGTVANLKVHTLGGVIAPGGPIMDVVPDTDELLVEAHASPKDIDIIHVGMPAKVMLTAYRVRYVPRVEGKVVTVSADRSVDDKTGNAYYKVLVKVDEAALKKLSAHVELKSGMPAEVFMIAEKSTFLDYLIDPIVQTFRHAFKEQ